MHRSQQIERCALLAGWLASIPAYQRVSRKIGSVIERGCPLVLGGGRGPRANGSSPKVMKHICLLYE